MKDFASARLAHDMFYNDFDNLASEDRVLVIDSGRGKMQLMLSALGRIPADGGRDEPRV